MVVVMMLWFDNKNAKTSNIFRLARQFLYTINNSKQSSPPSTTPSRWFEENTGGRVEVQIFTTMWQNDVSGEFLSTWLLEGERHRMSLIHMNDSWFKLPWKITLKRMACTLQLWKKQEWHDFLCHGIVHYEDLSVEREMSALQVLVVISLLEKDDIFEMTHD